MSIVMSESRAGIYCDGSCETSAGCLCHKMTSAYTPQPTPDYVHGPTGTGDLDNPWGEPEQNMLPPKWLARLLLALVVAIILCAAFIQPIGTAAS